MGSSAMHLFWWIFWILAIGLLFALMTPVSKGRAMPREAPLDILQRRYARGEISASESEDRKSRLTRDQPA